MPSGIQKLHSYWIHFGEGWVRWNKQSLLRIYYFLAGLKLLCRTCFDSVLVAKENVRRRDQIGLILRIVK